MSRSEFGPLSDEDKQAERRKSNKLAQMTDADAWKIVAGSQAGRRVLAHIIRESKYGDHETVFENDARNRIQQGAQSLGGFVVKEIRAVSLDLYRLMEDEQRGVKPLEEDDDADPAS